MLPTLFRKNDRSPLTSLRGEIDRLFEDYFSDGLPLPTAPVLFGTKGFVPAMDLKERDDAFVAELEMPGMKPEDFHVEVDEGVLVIRGERKQEKEEKTKQWHRTERVYGSFERHVALPSSVDAERVDASYKNGVLTVRVPKAPGSKPRTVQVKAE